jgi:hypothetical protein
MNVWVTYAVTIDAADSAALEPEVFFTEEAAKNRSYKRNIEEMDAGRLGNSFDWHECEIGADVYGNIIEIAVKL